MFCFSQVADKRQPAYSYTIQIKIPSSECKDAPKNTNTRPLKHPAMLCPEKSVC